MSSSNIGLAEDLIAREVMKIRPFTKSKHLELILSCRNLYNMDKTNKSPYCIIYIKEHEDDDYREIGRTEVILNSMDPSWSESIIIKFNSRLTQYIMCEIHDNDMNGTSEYMGRFTTTLAELVPYLNMEFVGQVKGYSNRVDYGDFIIVPGIVSGVKQSLDVSFCAHKLKKVAWFHNNDPFIVVNRMNDDGSFSVIARTKAARSTQNPIWSSIRMRVSSLCYGNLDHVLRFDCYDHRVSGYHKYIGSCHTSMRMLSHAPLMISKYRADNYTGILNIHEIHVGEAH